MEAIIQNSLSTAHSYTEYKEMVLQLIKEGKSTGENQNESLYNYTKLNNQRMKRLDKQTELSEDALGKTKRIQKDFTWLVLTESWCGDEHEQGSVLYQSGSLGNLCGRKRNPRIRW